MRLRTFTAETMADAMEEVRATLGADAIIVSTLTARRGRGVQVTAAVEPADDDFPPDDDVPEDDPLPDPVTDALRFHRVIDGLDRRLAHAARESGSPDPVMALAAAVDARFRFAPLPLAAAQPLALVGAPGAGKTVTAAKLAARSRIAGHTIAVITTDTVRSGGVGQLSGFTDLLDCPLQTAETPEELKRVLEAGSGADLTVIDTPGTNALNKGEVGDLADFLKVAGIEPVLVMAAGGDSEDARDHARTYARLGVRRIVGTRLDVTRRYGALLSAAESGDFAFSNVSITPFVAEGLYPLNPVSLARILTSETGGTTHHLFSEEKAAE
jgi:flagellar biosynthesis protein FlhF